jgi:hypothetical protein
VATLIALVVTGAMVAVIRGVRTGKLGVIDRLAELSARHSSLPKWVALPADVMTISLLIAVVGMYWDISFHLDEGRDPGPLANPAHYFILFGLFGIFFAGIFAVALARDVPSRASVRLANGWHAPLGAVIITFCGAISLIAFPLDDVWHRLFGQDVTLYGATHLLLIGGAAFSTVGLWLLHVEGQHWSAPGQYPQRTLITRIGEALVPGSVLLGLSTFQAEFDFGVPQFRLVLQPVLLMLAAGIALVAGRVRIGPGGALTAVGLFLAVRGFLALLVGPVLGNTMPHFPLYLVPALLVELAALRFSVKRPLRFGLIAGALIGTGGLAAEGLWVELWSPIPWTSALLEEAVPIAIVAALAAGLVGGFLGAALDGRPLRGVGQRRVALAATVVALATVLWGLPSSAPDPMPRADVTLRDVEAGDGRHVEATVQLDPPNAAEDDLRWLNLTAWQGGGSVIDQLKEIGPGRYRSTEPIPVHGNWKASIRLHRGRSVLAMPIFMPEDTAIPAAEVPAAASFTRSFMRDKELLQREQRDDVPSWTKPVAYTVVFGIGGSMLVVLGWALLRLGRTEPPRSGSTPPPARMRATAGAA